MATANERQVGGDHYKGSDYQHWDYGHDCHLHGIAWTASKYVSRSRRKNGREDLEKALHYYDKAQELKLQGCPLPSRMSFYWRFVTENKLTMEEAQIIWYIQEGQWEAARIATQVLLAGDR